MAEAADPLEGRVGECVACSCDAFEFARRADGFATCVCGHTQWAHARKIEAK